MNWRKLMFGLAIVFGLAAFLLFSDPTLFFGNGLLVERYWGFITIGRLVLAITAGVCAAVGFAMKG